jgi:4-amino-4-deoxy-L-arabinose transferase-like glycosyltransferase
MRNAVVSRSERDPRAEGAARPPRIATPVWWLGLGATALVTLAISFVAYSEGIAYFGIPQGDKAVHLSVGAALAFFLDGVLRRRMVGAGRVRVPLAALLVLVPAGVEELLQRYSPNRQSSFADYAADVAGVALGVWLSRRIAR